MTTRGFGPDEMRDIGRLIIEAIRARDDAGRRTPGIAAEVREHRRGRFPVPGLPEADDRAARGGRVAPRSPRSVRLAAAASIAAFIVGGAPRRSG